MLHVAVAAHLLRLLISTCGIGPQEVTYGLHGCVTGWDHGYNMYLGLNVVLQLKTVPAVAQPYNLSSALGCHQLGLFEQ